MRRRSCMQVDDTLLEKMSDKNYALWYEESDTQFYDSLAKFNDSIPAAAISGPEIISFIRFVSRHFLCKICMEYRTWQRTYTQETKTQNLVIYTWSGHLDQRPQDHHFWSFSFLEMKLMEPRQSQSVSRYSRPMDVKSKLQVTSLYTAMWVLCLITVFSTKRASPLDWPAVKIQPPPTACSALPSIRERGQYSFSDKMEKKSAVLLKKVKCTKFIQQARIRKPT